MYGGPHVAFFKSLLDENVKLTWEQLKVELIKHYGGIIEGDMVEKLASL